VTDWDVLAAEAAELLAQYVRIDTTNPPGRELAAASFLARELDARGIAHQVFEPTPGRANLVARLPATVPADVREEPIILLHHMDVVTADPERWSCDPFGGEVRDDCVWGRGTLDMKGAGILHLLAMDLLQQESAIRNRDIVLLAVADEEIESVNGVQWMLAHHADKVVGPGPSGIVWDEGGFGLRDFFGPGVVFTVAVTEKQAIWLRLVAEGDPGHGGMPHGNNPNDTLVRALGRVLDHECDVRVHPVVAAMFRGVAATQPLPLSLLLRHLDRRLPLALVRRSLMETPTIASMLHNTMSVTGLYSGEKTNVIPERAEAVIDARLLPDEDAEEFVERLREVIADDRVRVEVDQMPSPKAVSDTRGRFFDVLSEVAGRLVPGSVTVPMLTPGATDSAFFREMGLETFGLYPAVLTSEELEGFHGIDERISVDNLRLGLQIIAGVLSEMCATDG